MAEEALEKALDHSPQSLFERLFQSSPDAIVLTDAEGRITEVNAEVERLFGYARPELPGQAESVDYARQKTRITATSELLSSEPDLPCFICCRGIP